MWGRHAAGCSASFSSIRASLDSVRPMLSARPICVHQLRMLPVNQSVTETDYVCSRAAHSSVTLCSTLSSGT